MPHSVRSSELYVVGKVTGLAVLDNIAYVVCSGSSEIMTYKADELSPLRQQFRVEGMEDPRDIVADQNNHHLYVGDWGKWHCIWRVSAYDHSQYSVWVYIKLAPLTLSLSSELALFTLSLTSDNLLVTSSPRTLHRYKELDKEQVSDITLPGYVDVLWHAVETKREPVTFVVSYEGTPQDGKQRMVSKLSV